MFETYTPMEIGLLVASLLATGAVAGVLAGLLGVGGGIVIVPVLFLVFDALDVSDAIAMHLAVGTSLCTIIATSISSARAHHKRGAIDMELLKIWAPPIVVGSLLGGIVSKYLASSTLTMIFGCVALLVALNMAVPRNLVIARELPKGPVARGAVPLGVGVFSALMGIGGGTLSVPILSAFSVPVHRAVGTAAAFGLVIAVPATLGFMWAGADVEGRPPASLGYVNLLAAVLIFSVSALTAPLGSRIAHGLDAKKLKLAFAIFLFCTSMRMLWKAFA